MIFYYICTAVIFAAQILITMEAIRHFRYTLRKYRSKPIKYRPSVAIICPCKGLDTTFEKNINSLFAMEYTAYSIYFVVESNDDPACKCLRKIIQKHKDNNSQIKTHLVVAGSAVNSSQKLHNQLAVWQRMDKTVEVLAFIDSDACLKKYFLANLVHPLRRNNVGATTGYRWFVPANYAPASLILSAMNAFIASLLGPHSWNSTWGGAMAIKRELFERLGIADIWSRACTDDYTLTKAVKDAGLKVSFVPACFVASYEQYSWKGLFAFARRQFLITKVYMPHLWYLGLLGLGHFVLGFWLGVAATVFLYWHNPQNAVYVAILPVGLWLFSIAKAILRQLAIFKVLPGDKNRLLLPALIDICLQPIVAVFTLICLLAAGLSRKIKWRGWQYILHGPENIEIIKSPH